MMDIYTALAICCLIIIAASSAFRIIVSPTLQAEAAAAAVLDAHRRANKDRVALLARINETRASWADALRTGAIAGPVEMMLEIKQIDRIAERVASIADDLPTLPKDAPRQQSHPGQKYHDLVWKQVSVLNVCQSDLFASQTRLRRLKAAQQRASIPMEAVAA